MAGGELAVGIVIRCAARSRDAVPPYPIAVDLTCDEPKGMFCINGTFQHPDGFIAIHAAAIKAGWLERYADRGRLWLCPACSGKA